MSIDYICSYSGVPAKVGGRVEYTGSGKKQLGTITGALGQRLEIRLDGHKNSFPYHPTWEVRYLASPAPKGET